MYKPEPIPVEGTNLTIPGCPRCKHHVGAHTDEGCCGTKGSREATDCGCTITSSEFEGHDPDDIDSQLLMKAAEKIVLARIGEQFEILGCSLPGEDSVNWVFYVEKKGVPARSRRPVPVEITEKELEAVAREQQTVEQIQGVKPKRSEIQEKIRQEYGDSFEDLFAERD